MSLVLPLFLFAMLSIAYISQGFQVFASVQGTLFTRAKELSQQSYITAGHSLPNQLILLQETLDVKIPFLYSQKIPFSVTAIACTHPWTGYDITYTEGLPAEEELVYITPNGTVYHRNLNCTHLKLSIQGIPLQSVDSKRNENGGKYKRCEVCGKKGNAGVVYITASGDKYHMSLACSGLKRNVITIPISKVDGKPPCTRCEGD